MSLTVRSILVRSPNWIGDQVLAFPFFHYLRKHFPRARITAVCVPWVEDLQFRDLVDDVLILPQSQGASVLERFRFMVRAGKEAALRGPWDLGISLPNSFSSALYLYLAQCKRRRGYRWDGRGIFLNEGLPWKIGAHRHRADAYLELLPGEIPRALLKPASDFFGIPAENDLDEPIPGEVEAFIAEKSWANSHKSWDWVSPPSGERYWVLAPGATAESRRWPMSRFGELAEKIYRNLGYRGLVVGGVKESVLADELVERYPEALLDYTARGPVVALAPIFKNALFTVCNESGLAHVASLCGSPVRIVCGAADPRRTKPMGPGMTEVSFNPVECWPCEKNVCFQSPDKKNQCLLGMSSERIWDDLEAQLKLLKGLRK